MPAPLRRASLPDLGRPPPGAAAAAARPALWAESGLRLSTARRAPRAKRRGARGGGASAARALQRRQSRHARQERQARQRARQERQDRLQARAQLQSAPSRPSLGLLLPPPELSQLTCRAFAVCDARSGRVLHAHKATASAQIASLSKLMTALVVLDCCDLPGPRRGPFRGPGRARRGGARSASLDDAVRVSEAAAAVQGTTAALRAGETFAAGDLLAGLMLPSGNDAATALAEHFGRYCPVPAPDEWVPLRSGRHYKGDWERAHPVARFVHAMNARARQLGMARTHFVNPHGLMHRDHRSCARDVARLAVAALRCEELRRVAALAEHSCRSLGGKGLARREVAWANSNVLLGPLAGTDAVVDGLKTGITRAARGCLATSVLAPDRHLVVVTLGSDNARQRFVDNEAVARWALADFGGASPAVSPSSAVSGGSESPRELCDLRDEQDEVELMADPEFVIEALERARARR